MAWFATANAPPTPAAVPIALGDGGRCGGQNSSSSSMNSVGSKGPAPPSTHVRTGDRSDRGQARLDLIPEISVPICIAGLGGTDSPRVAVDTTVCRPRGARAADHGIEDERHPRLWALSRSIGTADRVPVTARCRLFVDCAINRGTWRPGQRTRRTLRVSATSPPDHREPTTMHANAPKMGREERRALLEQRRAAVARQLRRLAVELTDLDRQLEQIERSEC